MQVRTQIAVIAVIAAGWAAGNITVVQPVMAESSQMDRQRFAALESALARNPDDVDAARQVAQHYLDSGHSQLVVDAIARTSPAVQRDGRVSLLVARAQEQLGELQSASARLTGAMDRCTTTPNELLAGTGCEVRTQIDLAIESNVVERMMAWRVSPVTDPDRAALARDLATQPIRFVH